VRDALVGIAEVEQADLVARRAGTGRPQERRALGIGVSSRPGLLATVWSWVAKVRSGLRMARFCFSSCASACGV
jgi:hypothetical protein